MILPASYVLFTVYYNVCKKSANIEFPSRIRLTETIPDLKLMFMVTNSESLNRHYIDKAVSDLKYSRLIHDKQCLSGTDTALQKWCLLWNCSFLNTASMHKYTSFLLLYNPWIMIEDAALTRHRLEKVRSSLKLCRFVNFIQNFIPALIQTPPCFSGDIYEAMRFKAVVFIASRYL